MTFRESQLRYTLRKMITTIKMYKNKELEDKLFEEQILAHIEGLDGDYEEFMK